MYQRWRRLLFLHWDWDVAAVQATLPPGLTVDAWQGRAWLGVVPFRMEGVRPRFLPAVGGLSNFPELNVRTYVRDVQGRSGVWFYSLDCAQPLAVWVARACFGLPYFRARMREQLDERTAWISYDCRRRGEAGEPAHYEFCGVGVAARAGEGTFEEYLVERYRLFARRAGKLLTGEVWHEPYAIQAAEVARWSAAPLRQTGFDVGALPPVHAVFSPGVDVAIFPFGK
jgi:uncharacterized protein YqjF (DUF2071 family)